MQLIGYILGAAMIIAGVLVLTGYFEPRFGSPDNGALFSTLFGVILMLYGVYRIAVSESLRRRRMRERNINGVP